MAKLSALNNHVNTINKHLEQSGSLYHFYIRQNNGMYHVDRCSYKEEERIHCNTVVSGTVNECIVQTSLEFPHWLSKKV